MKIKTILISAGDPSGDFHAANLVKKLKGINPNIRFFGLGGENLSKHIHMIENITKESTIGFLEAIKKIFFFRNLLINRILPLIKKEKIDMVIVVDFYGFNIHLAKIAKKFNIKVLYYISPQLWASRPYRIKKIKKHIDKMLVLFPFEKEFYSRFNIDVEYVGHPFTDIVKPTISFNEILENNALPKNTPIIGLLPGSRKQEVMHLLPKMVKICNDLYLKKKFFVLIFTAQSLENSIIKKYLPSDINFPYKIVKEKGYDKRSVVKVYLTTSGSSTLENTFLGIPMIILYKVSFFSYLLAKFFVNIKHIGLPNIIAKRELVPEFVQYIPFRRISEILDIWISDSDIFNQIKRSLIELRNNFYIKDSYEKTARIILKELYTYN